MAMEANPMDSGEKWEQAIFGCSLDVAGASRLLESNKDMPNVIVKETATCFDL